MNVVITPFYNCDIYLSKCINSIKQQTEDFHCYLISDMSDDFSNTIAMDTQKHDERFTVILNTKKQYQCLNYNFIIERFCNDEDIIFTVDGDDKLINKDVVKYINDEYKQNDLWITYGSYINKSDGSLGISRQVANISTIRQDPWCASHLRTFKAWLFKKIFKEDFLDWEGKPLSMSGDQAFMIPMLEMSGEKHSRFINEPLYIYSDTNRLNDHKTDILHQHKCAQWVRSKQPYARLY
jgi:glycosyltransferase involved in cell wall biosynthesis